MSVSCRLCVVNRFFNATFFFFAVSSSLSAWSAERREVHEPSWKTTDARRASCTYAKGSLATATLGTDAARIPIKHVVVLMMENRSFDHYFSGLKKYYPEPWSEQQPNSVDAKADGYNLDSHGNKFFQKRAPHYCTVNTAHDWESVHDQCNLDSAGKCLMDGFVKSSEPNGDRAMFMYTEEDIPFYYFLANTFATSDRYFSPLLGPTWPNRFFFYGATSWGRHRTPDLPIGPVDIARSPDIVVKMRLARRSVKFYHDGIVPFAASTFVDPTRIGRSIKHLEEDARENKLGDLSIVDPTFLLGKSIDKANDEHPPSNMQEGSAFVARVVKALAANEETWKNTVLFITWDEHGGFYDHVPAPKACDPGDGLGAKTVDERGTPVRFDHYGPRVPLLVVSPYAKRHYVSHHVADHSSITRFIEAKFNLTAMTKRDANAFPLLDMFDFTRAPDTSDRQKLLSSANSVTVDQTESKWCKNNDPLDGSSNLAACRAALSSGPACKEVDQEPNNSPAHATPLAAVSCHSLFRDSGKTAKGSLPCAGDQDFFAVDAVDAKTCTVNPSTTILSDDVEICVFPICNNGQVSSVTCERGTKEEELGILDVGCCGTGKGKKIKLNYNCKGLDDSARIYYRVKPTSTANKCIDYSFKYEL